MKETAKQLVVLFFRPYEIFNVYERKMSLSNP